MNNKIIIGIVIVIIILGGGYFVAKKVKSTMNPASMPQQQITQTATPRMSPATTSGSMATVQEITVEGNEFAFTPATISVKQGKMVKITFKNSGKYPHNFTLADLNVQTQTIMPGEQATVSFTPDKTGNFTYMCTVPGHADKGMKGTLIVQ